MIITHEQNEAIQKECIVIVQSICDQYPVSYHEIWQRSDRLRHLLRKICHLRNLIANLERQGVLKRVGSRFILFDKYQPIDTYLDFGDSKHRVIHKHVVTIGDSKGITIPSRLFKSLGYPKQIRIAIIEPRTEETPSNKQNGENKQ